MARTQKNNNQKEFIARLMAVQAYYQVIHSQRPLRVVMEELLEDGLQIDEDEDGVPKELLSVVIKPHGGLFKKILFSLDERRSDIEEILKANINVREVVVSEIKQEQEAEVEIDSDVDYADLEVEVVASKDLEPLLKSILLCGICELLVNTHIDKPLIINDYLNVTHEFYGKEQVSFVNGVLDKISKSLM